MLLIVYIFFTTGIIKHGGVKPNIIPAYTELQFYLRTPLFKDLCDLKAKAEACFRAAAVATGCQVSLLKHIVSHLLRSVLGAHRISDEEQTEKQTVTVDIVKSNVMWS